MKNKVKRALYITVDGGDGSGKSTFIKNLNEYLVSLNKKVLLTKEFGSELNLFCQKAREIALSSAYEVDELAGQIMFASIARQHQQAVINPNLISGNFDIILSDRGIDSNYAYGPEHVKEQGINESVISDLFKIAYTDSILPDFTFYLDAETELTKKRRSSRKAEVFEGNGVDRVEKKGSEFQEKVRSRFLDLAKKSPNRIKVIKISDSTVPLDVLAEAIKVLTAYNAI